MTYAMLYAVWRLCCPMTCSVEYRLDSAHADQALAICAKRPSHKKFVGTADEFCGCSARMSFSP